MDASEHKAIDLFGISFLHIGTNNGKLSNCGIPNKTIAQSVDTLGRDSEHANDLVGS